MRRVAIALLILACLPPVEALARPSSFDALQRRSRSLREQQEQLNGLRGQRRAAQRRLSGLQRQAEEAQQLADRAEADYRTMRRSAALSHQKLDRSTFRYIGSVQSLGYSQAMIGGQTPELGQLADSVSAQDAVLFYTQGRVLVDQLGGQMEKLRDLAQQAAKRRERAQAALGSARLARQEAKAVLERQRQLRDLLARTEHLKAREVGRRQRGLAILFNQLLGSPEQLPGLDVSLASLPTQQRIVLLALREWRKGVWEVPLGSNDSPDIARYRTATVGAVRGGAWCAYFVSYIARRAGVPVGPQGSGTGLVLSILAWGRQNGRFFAADDSRYNPQPGDIIIWPSHTGLVINVDGNDMLTVEGNSSDRVKRQHRAVSSALGFVRLAGGRLDGAKRQGNPSAGSPGGSTL